MAICQVFYGIVVVSRDLVRRPAIVDVRVAQNAVPCRADVGRCKNNGQCKHCTTIHPVVQNMAVVNSLVLHKSPTVAVQRISVTAGGMYVFHGW